MYRQSLRQPVGQLWRRQESNAAGAHVLFNFMSCPPRLSLGLFFCMHVKRFVLFPLLAFTRSYCHPRRWTRQFLQSLQLSWKLAATCTRHRPSEERKLLQLRDRFGTTQDRIWNLVETAVRMVTAASVGGPKKPSQSMSSPRARSRSLQT